MKVLNKKKNSSSHSIEINIYEYTELNDQFTVEKRTSEDSRDKI